MAKFIIDNHLLTVSNLQADLTKIDIHVPEAKIRVFELYIMGITNAQMMAQNPWNDLCKMLKHAGFELERRTMYGDREYFRYKFRSGHTGTLKEGYEDALSVIRGYAHARGGHETVQKGTKHDTLVDTIKTIVDSPEKDEGRSR